MIQTTAFVLAITVAMTASGASAAVAPASIVAPCQQVLEAVRQAGQDGWIRECTAVFVAAGATPQQAAAQCRSQLTTCLNNPTPRPLGGNNTF